MSPVLAWLLAASLVVGFARPRWWLALAPVTLAIGLNVYRLTAVRTNAGGSQDAIAFLGIVLLALAMEGALIAGVLARAGMEQAHQRPATARAALRTARGVALVAVAFAVSVIVMAQASNGTLLLLGLAAVAVVLARAWRARLRGPAGPRRRGAVAGQPATKAPRGSAHQPRGSEQQSPAADRRARLRARRAAMRSASTPPE